MRAVAWFWAVVLLLAAGAAGMLAWLGPPAPRSGPGAVAAAVVPGLPAAQGPRIAVLVAGIGMIAADSQGAIAALPAAVSLAVSPYAPDPAGTAKAARDAGHEVLLSLPMQPGGGAAADAGNEALTNGQDPSVTAARLAWALGRVPGPAGATDLLGPGLDGAAFAGSPSLVAVTDTLAARHLFFLDARRVTMLDAPATTPSQALDALVAEARRRGGAVGAIAAPAPDLVAALTKLLPGLTAAGVRLVPVGQIMTPSQQ
jgi:polysaccharide deacetylase 2 family uncharacterized protein YibQ